MGDVETEPTPTAPPLKRGEHHRPYHWVILSVNIIIALACFIGAVALVIGQRVQNNIQKTAPIQSPPTVQSTGISIVVPGSDSTDTVIDGTAAAIDPEVTTTTETFPDADPSARNFLITGSDNRACPDPGTANPVPDRSSIGERSDSIMIMRVDPTTSRAAVLSFPRDLWVKIDGTNGRNRINSAFSVNDPQKLVNTIYINFFIKIDHYIQIDFCAFKTLVDAVGGVSVYFNYPAQDKNTGLNVPDAGCYTFNGDAALAYVRSRHYKYLDPDTGKYTEDPLSDYGRISRQQDFLRRAVAKVLSTGYDITLARSLIKVATDYVVTDPDLTIDKELQFAGVLKRLDPQAIQTYQIEGTGTIIGGASVILPRLDGDNMQAILKIFRGEAQLAAAPEQVFESTTSSVEVTTTTVARATTTTVRSAGTTVAGFPTATTRPTTTTSTTSTTTTVPATTLPESNAAEINRGIYPPKDKTCP